MRMMSPRLIRPRRAIESSRPVARLAWSSPRGATQVSLGSQGGVGRVVVVSVLAPTGQDGGLPAEAHWHILLSCFEGPRGNRPRESCHHRLTGPGTSRVSSATGKVVILRSLARAPSPV